MNTPLLLLRYEGEGAFLTAHPRLAKLCDERLVIGEVYSLEPREDRSMQSHAHYFACINNAWLNLPEHLTDRFPSSEHLRKYALVKAGHCDIDAFVASSLEEALRLAAFLRSGDEYAVIVVAGETVTRYRAKSQSLRSQGKAEFQLVKDRVLYIISQMIGTDAVTLGKAEAA